MIEEYEEFDVDDKVIDNYDDMEYGSGAKRFLRIDSDFGLLEIVLQRDYVTFLTAETNQRYSSTTVPIKGVKSVVKALEEIIFQHEKAHDIEEDDGKYDSLLTSLITGERK